MNDRKLPDDAAQDQVAPGQTETPVHAALEPNILCEPGILFPAGFLAATPGALQALERAGVTPWPLLERHLRGDWGDLDEHDRQENGRALAHGLRLLSSYFVDEDVRVWIITEADRSATTLLLPSDY